MNKFFTFKLLEYIIINILHIRNGKKELLYPQTMYEQTVFNSKNNVKCRRFFTSFHLKLLCILYGIMSHGEFDADQTPWFLSKLSYRSRHLGGDDQGGLPTAQSDMGAMADGIHDSKHHIICISPCIPLSLYLHLTIRFSITGHSFNWLYQMMWAIGLWGRMIPRLRHIVQSKKKRWHNKQHKLTLTHN